MNEQLAVIEAKYLGKPMPTPLAQRPEEIAARRDEAIKQLYEAASADDPRVVQQARLQFALMQSVDTPTGRTVVTFGRNDPCPCGSGKKFKRCCMEGTLNA